MVVDPLDIEVVRLDELLVVDFVELEEVFAEVLLELVELVLD